MTCILCLAHNFKGGALLREAKRRGCYTILLTREERRGEPWPGVDEFHVLPTLDESLPLVCRIAQRRRIDLIFPLDERDVERAAVLRAHLLLRGMQPEQAIHFRDKLAMRQVAAAAGIPNPAFVHVLNHRKIAAFTRAVSPPWMLKPRSEAGSFGILRIDNERQLWANLEALGDEQSEYLLEEAVDGDVYHVDSLVHRGQILFSQAHKYGAPPFRIWNSGGVFTTGTVAPGDPMLRPLLDWNRRVLASLRLQDGPAHVEFLTSSAGQVYFLEAAARVPGANIDVLIEETSAVNFWHEWLKMELFPANYRRPKRRARHGVLLQCLARTAQPDLSQFDAPETVWKLDKPRHAGMIVVSPQFAPLQELAARYRRRLESEHLAVLAPPRKKRKAG